jgi:hypothetical protein
MNPKRYIAVLALGIGMCMSAIAQAPAGAPAGSTGQCNDGSYTNAATKAGACRGHKGVKTWFAASAPGSKPSAKPSTASKTPAASSAAPPAPAAANAPVAAGTASSSAPSSAPKSSSPSNTSQAPGGGPGMVWVNTASNVYHCGGTRYYGKTKAGKYMTEAEAKAAGARPDHGKGCGQ